MDQIKIGKFIADERKRKGYTQKQQSVIKQFQNGREEMVFQKYHCCCHYVMNWR